MRLAGSRGCRSVASAGEQQVPRGDTRHEQTFTFLYTDIYIYIYDFFLMIIIHKNIYKREQ